MIGHMSSRISGEQRTQPERSLWLQYGEWSGEGTDSKKRDQTRLLHQYMRGKQGLDWSSGRRCKKRGEGVKKCLEAGINTI